MAAARLFLGCPFPSKDVLVWCDGPLGLIERDPSTRERLGYSARFSSDPKGSISCSSICLLEDEKYFA